MPGQEPQAPPQEKSSGGRGGRVKKAVVGKKVGEVKDYMEDVAALVHNTCRPIRRKFRPCRAQAN